MVITPKKATKVYIVAPGRSVIRSDECCGHIQEVALTCLFEKTKVLRSREKLTNRVSNICKRESGVGGPEAGHGRQADEIQSSCGMRIRFPQRCIYYPIDGLV